MNKNKIKQPIITGSGNMGILKKKSWESKVYVKLWKRVLVFWPVGRDTQATDLMHWTHVDDAVPFRRHSQNLIQDLFHVQLLTLGIVKPINYGCVLYSQLLQHTTSGGYTRKDNIWTHFKQYSVFGQFLLDVWTQLKYIFLTYEYQSIRRLKKKKEKSVTCPQT